MTTSTGIKASLKRIVGRSRKIEVAPGFRGARGLRYVTFFERLHAQAAFDWYMEIGCRSGQIFQHAQGRTIAVDPFFQVERNVIGTKPAMFAFQQTSDDFFASGFLERNAIRLSASFLDGMHLFEFLLRDFMNTEDHSHEDGVILMHDCSPYDLAMTSRDYSDRSGLPWTGDVWKLLPILQEHRPDLAVEVLDCSPTGLVLVRGLSPGNRVLRDRYDSIVRAYADLTLEAFGVERFFASFAHVDAAAEADAGFPRFRPIMIEPTQVARPERSSP
ncbi:hypothetical protein [Tabrizicola sp.]|uniref:hypothetical protein n=1 Tax=Tabrizicola sp. TaxID=2005166 RepID=UPI0035AFFBD1